MNRLRRLIEIGSQNERTGRAAYVLRQETLPDPNACFKWVEDSTFSAAEAVLADPSLKDVFSSAIATGHAIVGQSKDPSRTSSKLRPSVFTVEIDGKPIVSFEAKSNKEAQELAKEAWFLEDMRILTAEGQVLWDGKATLRARVATDAEVTRYGEIADEAEEENGDIVLAFLVTLDGPSRR